MKTFDFHLKCTEIMQDHFLNFSSELKCFLKITKDLNT